MDEILNFGKVWEKLKDDSTIKFKDFRKLEDLLGSMYQKIDELRKSRDKWRERALKKEKKC